MIPLTKLATLSLEGNPLNRDHVEYASKEPDIVLEFLRKVGPINIFLAHTIEDIEACQINQMIEFLGHQKEISKVFYADSSQANKESEQIDNISQSHLLLFIATKNSLFNSLDCRKAIELADKYTIPIIPIKGPDIDWPDLAELNLARELGQEFRKDDEKTFFKELYSYVTEFKHNNDLFLRVRSQYDVGNIEDQFLRGNKKLEQKIGMLTRMVQSLEIQLGQDSKSDNSR